MPSFEQLLPHNFAKGMGRENTITQKAEDKFATPS